MVEIINESGVSHFLDHMNSMWITENHKIKIFGTHTFKVKRIFRVESQLLTLADEFDGVVISIGIKHYPTSTMMNEISSVRKVWWYLELQIVYVIFD